MKEAEIFLNNLLKKNDTIVIGVSGGPDSMCLLYLLNSLKEKFNLKIICAHVNHGLRSESEEEKIFVEEYCKQNNLIFAYMKINNYENNKFSEEKGRNKRYNFFKELVKKYQASFLMTAHHGDDLIETIMMRIVRGSNLNGYQGISKITNYDTYKLVRPLLFYSKQDILNYLDDNNIKYVVDKSNDDELYTRNRYRKHLLPFLKKEDKNVHRKFLEYSEELETTINYIDKIVKDKYLNIKKNGYLDIEVLKNEDDYIIKKVIEKEIKELQKDNLFNINKDQLNNIIELLKNNDNKKVNLANGFMARKSYNKLYIEKDDIYNNYEYELKDKLNILNKFDFEIVNYSIDTSNYTIRINKEEIKLPLIVRNKKNGDKIKVKNLNGTKKVKDIFIEKKIDINKRKIYPIVSDSNDNIIWIPGLKKSIFDKEISEKYDIIIKYVEEENE